MKELYEKILEELRSGWRYRWTAIGTAWFVCLVGWPLVLSVPVEYEATARIFVDSRTMLSQVTQGLTVDNPVETQLQRVRQSLLGAPELEKIIQETHADKPGMTLQQRQALLESVRKRVGIGGSTTRESATGGVYGISFHDTDRALAVRVVEALIQHFLANAKAGKREGSEQTQEFLVSQIAEYEARLSESEQRLANFKKTNVGMMPGEKGDYFARLQGETAGIERAQSQLIIASRRRDEIERQLRGAQPEAAGEAASQGGASTQFVVASETTTKLREAQSRLDELLLRYTDKHPDVINLRETIAGLKSRQQADVNALRRGDSATMSNSALASNPIYQSIQLQLNQSGVEIAALRAEIGDRQARMAELRKLVNTAPEVEADLARLNRDYQVTRTQYQGLIERLDRTRMSDDADATGLVRYEVIDPAHAPLVPASPQRTMLMIAVLLAGLGAGGGVAYMLTQLRPVFYTEKQLQAATGLTVLGSVSHLDEEIYARTQRMALTVSIAAVGGLVILGFMLLRGVLSPHMLLAALGH